MCISKKIQIFALTLAAVGLVSILITLFVFNYPTFARTRVIDAVLFKNGSDSMIRFQTTADLENLRLSFHVFNITNPEEVKKGEKFHLEEIGPFVYSEFKSRQFIDNDQKRGLITYDLTRHYRFEQEVSYKGLDPKTLYITWLNIPLIAAIHSLNELNLVERLTAYEFINNKIKEQHEDAFITDSIHNFLIGGSHRQIMEYIESLQKRFDPKKEWPLINNTFGILYGKNGLPYNHVLTTSAGFGPGQTYRDLNQYKAFDYKPNMIFWKDQPAHCNQVSGTDGEFFSPFPDKREGLEILGLDLCRKLGLKYKKNTTMLGIHTWEYVLDERSLAGPMKKDSGNECYCLAKDPKSPECQLDGLIDLQTCNNQANVFASGAHYWAGSKELFDGFEGDNLEPISSNHEPTFLVEPRTGLAVKVKVPIQFNIKVVGFKRGHNFDIFNFTTNEQPIFVPFAWVEECSEMTPEQAEMLKRELLIFDTWLITMVLGGAIILIIAIIVAAVVLCLKLKNSGVHNLPRPATENDPLLRRA